MTTTCFDQHRDRLDAAVAACASREYFSAFDESPSPRVYGETAAADGQGGVRGVAGRRLPARDARQRRAPSATERSPFGFDLGVRYPRAHDVDALLARGAGRA